MKKEEEIEKLSQSILKTIDSVASLTVTKEEENIFHQGFYSGYRQCEKQHYTEEDINEMACDFVINVGGLPKTIEEWQNALWKFYQSLNKQD